MLGKCSLDIQGKVLEGMVYGREKSTSGCLRATVLFERWRKGLMGVLVSASTLQARNPLRKKLRRNLEVKKESIPHYYDE